MKPQAEVTARVKPREASFRRALIGFLASIAALYALALLLAMQ